MKYIIFQVLKDNNLVVIIFLSDIILFFYSIILLKFSIILAILAITIEIFLIDIYCIERKITIILAGSIAFIGIMMPNIFLAFIGTILICYCLFIDFKKILLKKLFHNNYREIFISNKAMSFFRINALYFLRMPMNQLLEFFLEIIILLIGCYFLNVNILLYVFVAIFLVDLELLQDEKMNNYDFFCGRRNFLQVTSLSLAKRFGNSLEFKYLLKYIVLMITLLMMQISKNSISPYLTFKCINVILLLSVITLRYYNVTDLCLKFKKNVLHTWFRFIMLYTVLFALSPFIFEISLLRTNDYNVIYGCLFSAVIIAMLYFIKVERIIKVYGEKMNEKHKDL